MEETIKKLIEKGSIEVSDDFSFRTKAECASIFGRTYFRIVPGGVPHPKEKNKGLVFWSEEYSGGVWENEMLDDGNTFIEEKKIDFDGWISKIQKDKDIIRLFFWKSKNGRYTYKGEFLLDVEDSILKNKKIYRKIGDISPTFPPENGKGIENLKDLISLGKVSVNQKVYLSHQGIVFLGRITRDGMIQTEIGVSNPSKSATLLTSSPVVNGYTRWKIWNGKTLSELKNP
jgi:hypothetical protein